MGSIQSHHGLVGPFVAKNRPFSTMKVMGVPPHTRPRGNDVVFGSMMQQACPHHGRSFGTIGVIIVHGYHPQHLPDMNAENDRFCHFLQKFGNRPGPSTWQCHAARFGPSNKHAKGYPMMYGTFILDNGKWSCGPCIKNVFAGLTAILRS